MPVRLMQRCARRSPVLAVLAAAVTLVLVAGALAQGDDEGPEVSIQLLADGLAAPTFLSAPDDGTGRRFVTDQTGEVRIITREGELVDEPFLDLSDRLVELDANYDERGLLGLAVSPRLPRQRALLRLLQRSGAR